LNNLQASAHYGRSDFEEAIYDWLRQQGKDLESLTADDLTPIDQFHGGQAESTRSLAKLAKVRAGMRVADLGGGLGGPARFLVDKYGATVDVVDLTAEFCRLGEQLTKQVGLADNVRFRCASATATGLEDEAYDLVWMQNAAMNIEDRHALYSEIRRLLRPGGQYVFQEVLAGDGGPAYYPINWATSASESFLQSPENLLRLVLESGFRCLYWEDETESTAEARRERRSYILAGNAPPGYMSPEIQREAALNGIRASEEDRLRFGRGLFQKL
jgi:SAM-dependent methyltransferase